ncbi:expressed protein [Phakopsora pachyrhizi]|uniref:Expressed protein n=1 Tax=Phakopsora pachyrhizi TaxID=170000 RepID=A0AAV0AT45_PHAPC|nr:expressed protein [Phakopsora pachyrhizi]
MPKDPLNSPQSSKVRDRELDGYNKQSREALNLNPRTTFQIFGPINANTKINQLNKLINKESSNLITSEKRKRKVTQLELKAIESFEERLDLIRVLKEDFTIGPKETSQKSKNYIFLRRKKKYPEEEAKYQKYIGKKVLNFLREQRPKENRHPEFSISVEVDSRFRRSEISAFDNRKRSEIIESAFRIQWNGFDAIEKSISDNAYNFRDHKDMKAQGATLLHIENISNLGITFMKIIAKKYPKGLVSDEFGDDQCLLAYNNLFWNFCFKNHKDLKEDVRVFFRSIRGNSSEKDIDQFVSAKLSVKHNKPEVIFSIIKTRITTKTDRNQILLFSWYFVFLRTMVYYPELIFQCSLDGNQLKTFIENGILYFIQKYNKI